MRLCLSRAREIRGRTREKEKEREREREREREKYERKRKRDTRENERESLQLSVAKRASKRDTSERARGIRASGQTSETRSRILCAATSIGDPITFENG